jgi:hypothetical protein
LVGIDHLLAFEGGFDIAREMTNGAKRTDKTAEEPSKEKGKDNDPYGPSKTFDPLVS